MTMLHDPREFAAASDALGKRWIEGLPSLTATMCRRWHLTRAEGSVRNGYRAVVRPVIQNGRPCVLKLSWPIETVILEARALAAWNGSGAVTLLDVDTKRGALLLERLDAECTLGTVPIRAAAGAAGGLLRRLAIHSPDGFPTTSQRASEIAASLRSRQEALGNPIPQRLITAATATANSLAVRRHPQLLVHADLHYGNVLARGEDTWAAIDPKPVTGDPEHAVPELMWTRLDEVTGTSGVKDLLHLLVDAGALDHDLALAWTVTRCVDYWLWGIEYGLTEDPVRCARIATELC